MALSEAGGDRFDDGMSLDADPGTTTVSPAEGFRLAAAHAVRLTAAVPADAWDDPALGQWTVRSLVGHLGRAMSTVVDALTTPATEATVSSAADYYRQVLDRVDPDAIRLRGEQAGTALGDDPAAALRTLADRAGAALAQTGDRLVTTAAGGMWLSHYLPTRTFELAVHGLDLARATGQPATVPTPVLREALALVTELAVHRGHGESVLLALTGRAALPTGFGVL